MTSEAMKVVSVNVSEKKGTVKHPVAEAMIDQRGLVGDAHAGTTNRLVSLLARESIEGFVPVIGRALSPGEFAENLTTCNLDQSKVAPLDRFQIGAIELEVTQIGKKCHGDRCAIYREVGRCVMPQEGIFCRVISGGTVRAGDIIRHMPRQLRFKIITVSDRASRGEYEDRSGPRIKELIEESMPDKRWHIEIDASVVPDDPGILRQELRSARSVAYDVVITTGGTGVGPRDVTPDVVADECDKLIPGIMEYIRMKYGAKSPTALLSRSVAGVLGDTLVYSLPGSVKAVEEYMNEILESLGHLVLMVHAVDAH